MLSPGVSTRTAALVLILGVIVIVHLLEIRLLRIALTSRKFALLAVAIVAVAAASTSSCFAAIHIIVVVAVVVHTARKLMA